MNYRKWLCAALASSALHTLPVVPAAAQVEPLPIEIAAAGKQFRSYSQLWVSPDGRYVAYTIRDYRRLDVGLPMDVSRVFSPSGVQMVANYGCDIYVTDLRTGETRVVTGGRGSNWAPAWSARGDRLAFVSDRDGMARLWVWHADDDRLQRVSPDPVVVQFEQLAWVNDDAEILVEMLPAGMTFEDQNRHMAAAGHTDERFHPESSVTVFTHLREPDGRSQETMRLEGYQGHSLPAKKSLGLVDVATGSVRIVEKDWTGTIQAVDADGRYLLATQTVGVDSRNVNLPVTTIFAVDLRSGRTVYRIEEIPSGYNPSYVWSPSAARFAYFVREQDGSNDRLALFLADVPAAETRRLATLGESEQFYAESIAWLPDGRSFVVNAGHRAWIVDVDDGSASKIEISVINAGGGSSRGFHLLTTRRNGALWQPPGATNVFYVQAWDDAVLHQQIDAVDIVTGTVRKVHEERLQYSTPLSELRFDASRGGEVAAFVAGDAAHPPEIWVTASRFQTIRRITNLHSELDGYTFGRHRLVEWTGTDGKRYKGTLILPTGYVPGQRHPTVVWQRAGESGAQLLNSFGGLSDVGENWQVLATRGYAVFFPEFNNRKASDIPVLLRTSLLPALDTLVAMGISDPERFGITGESLGGAVTMSIIALTDRFAAAVNTVGPCDEVAETTMLVTPSGNAFRIQEGLSSIGGTPWSNREAYIEASPFYQLHKIRTPLLMAVSRGNWTDTLPQYLTDGCYVGLRHLNQTDVQYAIYSGGHGPFAFSYADRIDWWSRLLAWFDKYLKKPKVP